MNARCRGTRVGLLQRRRCHLTGNCAPLITVGCPTVHLYAITGGCLQSQQLCFQVAEPFSAVIKLQRATWTKRILGLLQARSIWLSSVSRAFQ